jgi:hypothetical protein
MQSRHERDKRESAVHCERERERESIARREPDLLFSFLMRLKSCSCRDDSLETLLAIIIQKCPNPLSVWFMLCVH